MITTITAIIGYISLLTNKDPKQRPGVFYTGNFFATVGIIRSVALFLSWPAVNVSGQTKRAVAGALQVTIGNSGVILCTQLSRPKTSPRYFSGHSFVLGYLCMNLAVVSTLWFVFRRDKIKKQDYLVNHPEIDGVEEDLKQGDRHPRWKFNVQAEAGPEHTCAMSTARCG